MTEKPKIGDPGSPDNVGQASRAPHIKISRVRICKYDKMWSITFFSAVGLSAVTLGFVALGVWLFFMLTWWSILLGLLSLGAAYLAGQLAVIPWPAVWSRFELYWDSSLCGAVVLSTEPTMALALMNLDTSGGTVRKRFDADGREVSSEEYKALKQRMHAEWDEKWEQRYEAELDPQAADRMLDEFWDPFYDQYTYREDDTEGKWGCQLVKVGEGDWSLKAGDRIPCSSAFGSSDEEREVWTQFQAMPLVWATKNKADLEGCVAKISDFEWKLLEQAAAAVQKAPLRKGEVYLIHKSETAPGGLMFEPLNGNDEEGEDTPEDSPEKEE